MRRVFITFVLFLVVSAVCPAGNCFVTQKVRVPGTGAEAYRTTVAIILYGADEEGQSAFEASAESLRGLLADWRVPKDNIVIARVLSRNDVDGALADVRKFTTDRDRILLFCIAHGKEGGPHAPVLALQPAGNAGDIPVGDIVELFRGLKARHRLLVIDACYSGSFELGHRAGAGKGPEVFTKNSSAVLLSSAPNAAAKIGEVQTEFVQGFVEAARDTVRDSHKVKVEGLYLTDLVHNLEAKLPVVAGIVKAKPGAGGGDSEGFQVLLNETVVDRSARRLAEPTYDAKDAKALAEAIDRYRKELEQTGLSLGDRAYLEFRLGCALAEQLEPSLRRDSLKEAVQILIELKGLEEQYQFDRRFVLAWAAQELAETDRPGLNLDQAIGIYTGLLRDAEGFLDPQTRAALQNNLGNAYWYLAEIEDPAGNLKRAIEAYTAALRVFTEKELPRDWATTQNNLGNAYRKKAEFEDQDPAGNLKRAIEAYTAALRVFTEKELPRDWAGTPNNLGNAYSDLAEIEDQDPAGNLKRAIGAYTAALRVFTEKELPRDWAMTQYNLGNAYAKKAEIEDQDQAGNLTRAIGAYTAALRVRTEKKLPRDWATTQYNLGLAYSDLAAIEDRTANLTYAVDCFRNAARGFESAGVLSLAEASKAALADAEAALKEPRRPL